LKKAYVFANFKVNLNYSIKTGIQYPKSKQAKERLAEASVDGKKSKSVGFAENPYLDNYFILWYNPFCKLPVIFLCAGKEYILEEIIS